MRPITLTMEAFGPFSNVETIEFEKFKDKGIFLITGPTGAGKTTIFDALIYALYGVSSGDQRDAESFRSDHAKSDQLTSVTLNFELKGKHYQVKRIPKQMRAKLSGEGLTIQNADAELIGDGLVLSGVKDVTEKINQLFGLNAEQFRQIMMIPQGEFRRLILSDSKEKSEIFRKLFGTSLFERMQDKMKLEEDLLKNQYFELGSQLKALLGQLSLQNDLEPYRDQCLENPVAPNLKNLMGLVHKAALTITSEIEADKVQIKTSEKRLDQIKLQISDQKLLKVQTEALTQTIALLSKHLENEVHIEGQRSKLDLAQKAASMRAEAENRADKKAVLMERTSVLSQIELALKTQTIDFDTCRIEYEGLSKSKTDLEALKKDLMSLELIQEEVKTFAQDGARLQALLETISTSQAKKVKYGEAIEQAKKLQMEIGQQVTALQADKLMFAELVNKRTELGHLEGALKDAIEKKQALNVKKDQLKALKEANKTHGEALEQARETWILRDQAFMEGYSGLLAKSLKASEPCPVCGSLDHPNPAIEAAVVTKEALDASRKHLDLCQSQFDKSTLEYAALSEMIDEAQKKMLETKGQLADQFLKVMGITLDAQAPFQDFKTELVGYLHEVNQRGKLLKARVEGEAELMNQQKANDEKLEKHLLALKTLEENLSALLIECEGLKSKRDQIAGKVPEAFRDYERLMTEIKAIGKRIDTLNTSINHVTDRYNAQRDGLNLLKEKHRMAKEEYNTAEMRLNEAEVVFKEALKTNGFESEAQFNQVNLTKEALKTLGDQVDGFYKTKQDFEKSIEVQKHQLEGRQVLDIEGLQAKLAQQEDEISKVRQKLNQNMSTLSHNEKVTRDIEAIMLKSEKISTKNAYVTKLAKMARGQNAQRLSFENFVLSQYFEDVLGAANLRLQRMTTGRFELVRKKERSKGNAQSGLDIEVMDQYTGKLRHVKTLSGGETFKASLSLALGLSDVVQRFSGGISLETMFIDEGFGTLDSDSLDKAIESLMNLSSQNRLVGIISHVQELKERIQTQLLVVQEIEGSHTKIQC